MGSVNDSLGDLLELLVPNLVGDNSKDDRQREQAQGIQRKSDGVNQRLLRISGSEKALKPLHAHKLCVKDAAEALVLGECHVDTGHWQIAEQDVPQDRR